MREFGSTPGSWLVRGYVDAVARFREQAAIGSDSARDVFPPLFEALNWAHSLWDTWFRLVEPQDRHLDSLRHVRDRCHHQLASAIYPDPSAPGGWRWHAIAHLPTEDPGRKMSDGVPTPAAWCRGVGVDGRCQLVVAAIAHVAKAVEMSVLRLDEPEPRVPE